MATKSSPDRSADPTVSPRSAGTGAAARAPSRPPRWWPSWRSARSKYFQAFPEYGPERSGAPIVAFTRVSDEPIQVYSGIEHPQIVVVLDPSLLSIVDVTKGAPDDAIVLVNSEMTPGRAAQASTGSKGFRYYTIAATRIATETIRRPIPNTPMVGALTRITGLFPIDEVVEFLRVDFGKKFPPKVVEGNIAGHHAQLRGGPGRMTVEKKAGGQEAGPAARSRAPRSRPQEAQVGHQRPRHVGPRQARAGRHHPRGRQLRLQRDRRLAHAWCR